MFVFMRLSCYTMLTGHYANAIIFIWKKKTKKEETATIKQCQYNAKVSYPYLPS